MTRDYMKDPDYSRIERVQLDPWQYISVTPDARQSHLSHLIMNYLNNIVSFTKHFYQATSRQRVAKSYNR